MTDLKPCPFVEIRETFSEVINQWNDPFEPTDQYDRCVSNAMRKHGEAIDAAITAWNTRAATKVKPLEWVLTSYETPESKPTTVGVYRINSGWNGGYTCVLGRYVLAGPDGRTNFPTKGDAKAAAQSDYESRILSALETET